MGENRCDWNYECQRKTVHQHLTNIIPKLQNCEPHTPTSPVNLCPGGGNEEQLQSMQLTQQNPQT